MRLPRLRFTVRRMMVTVAVVGGALGYWRARERWAIFNNYAYYHAYLQEIYSLSIDNAEGVLINRHPEIEANDPEPPPIPDDHPVMLEIGDRRKLAEHHTKMERYWRSRW
jgi:hypothetical protein